MKMSMKQAIAQFVISLKRATSGSSWLWNCSVGGSDGIIEAINPVETAEPARSLAYNPESFG